MNAPQVMGLDPSLTATGLAFPAGTAHTRKPPDGLAGMARIAWHLDRLFEANWIHGTDLVVVEGYSFSSKGNATRDLAELGGVIRYTLWRNGKRWADVPPPTLKIFATGKGTCDKTAMVVAARERLGYDGLSGDEADALWLRELGLHLLDHPTVKLPLTHLRALPGAALHEPPT